MTSSAFNAFNALQALSARERGGADGSASIMQAFRRLHRQGQRSRHTLSNTSQDELLALRRTFIDTCGHGRQFLTLPLHQPDARNTVVGLFAMAVRDSRICGRMVDYSNVPGIMCATKHGVELLREMLTNLIMECLQATLCGSMTIGGPAGCALVMALVKADTISAYAQLLAADHAALRPGSPTYIMHALDAAYAHVSEASFLLQGILMPLSAGLVDVRPGLRRKLRAAVLRSLAGSGVVEQLCRLRLAAQERHGEPGGPAPARDEDAARADLQLCTWLADGLSDAWMPAVSCDHRDPSSTLHVSRPVLSARQWAQLRGVLSGPALQLYLGWRLAAPLAQRAGRPLYGMPASLQLAAAGGCAGADPGSAAAFGAVATIQAATAVWYGLLLACDGTAGGSGAAGRPALAPYSMRHVCMLLLPALAREDAKSEHFGRTVKAAARLLVGAIRRGALAPRRAAAVVRDLWPQLLRGFEYAVITGDIGKAPPDICLFTGQLLALGDRVRAPSRGAGDGGTGTAAPDPASPSWSLRCALDAGLVPRLESLLRHTHGVASMDHAGSLVLPLDLLLRRSGAWPALLAHGSAREVAALIVTMRKLTAEVAAAWPHERRLSWSMLLLGLLEQAAAAMQPPDQQQQRPPPPRGAAADAGGARPQTKRRGAANPPTPGAGAGTPAAAPGLRLLLNRGTGDSLAAGQHGAEHRVQFPRRRPNAARRGAADELGGYLLGPAWADVRQAGGCPPPGSPAAEQQRRLAVFAAAQWLPEVIAQRAGRGAARKPPTGHSGPVGTPLDSLSRHFAYTVPLHWLTLAARECLAARKACLAHSRAAGAAGPTSPTHTTTATTTTPHPAEAAYRSWRSFLVDHTAAVYHAFLTLPLLAEWDTGAAARPVREGALDLMELLAAALPEEVEAWKEAVLGAMPEAQRERATHGAADWRVWEAVCRGGGARRALKGAVEQLLRLRGRNVRADWMPGPGMAAADAVAPMGKGEGAEAGAEGAWRPLPTPCEAAALLPTCCSPGCATRAGHSEADVALLVCGGCRAVRYCCQDCQRAHWRAGHKEECGKAARGAG